MSALVRRVPGLPVTSDSRVHRRRRIFSLLAAPIPLRRGHDSGPHPVNCDVHKQRADPSLTLRSRHSVLVQIAGDGVGGDLRHLGAVLAASTGASLAELMARLGHSTPQAAMRYQHASADATWKLLPC